jgi:Deacetylase PdaC/Protein of unknown function (DUF3298)
MRVFFLTRISKIVIYLLIVYYGRTMKKYILLLVSIFLIASGCEEGSLNTSDLSEIKNTAKPTNALRATSPSIIRDLEYKTAILEDEQDGYYYEIEYPTFIGGDEKIREKINQEVYDHIQNELSIFLADYDDTDHEYDTGLWSLGISFYVNRNDDAFVSIVMQASIYTGGAHPNSYSNTFNFNIEEGGELMDITDVFNPVATAIHPQTGERQDYLDFISDYTMDEIAERDISDEDWILSGAGSEKDNYQAFYLSDYEIIFIFDPYQVAAYAVGPQEVAISFDDLAGYLKAYAF